ncbi:MAG TPA: hypothetical protein VG917_01180, partial [Patescibacteria group bacterium]|nr:hypothetical protein [Patescibacteria group bacterium]
SAATTVQATTTGTTTTTNQTTGSAAVTYQQPAPSSAKSSAADPCGGKTQLAANESFTLQVGCHVKGEVYVWYNNTWAKRFDDDPSTGAIMWCPAAACDVKTGNWGAGLSSKDPVALQKEGCSSPCNYIQLIPLGAYTKGNGPDNPMYELPQWTPVCGDSGQGLWTTIMRTDPNFYAFNAQGPETNYFDACRQDAYGNYKKLQSDH